MKLRDFMEAQAYFGKPTKVARREITFKDFVKFKKALEEYEKLEKEKNDKSFKKEEKKSAFTVLHKTILLTFLGLFGGPVYLWFLLSLAKDMANYVK